MNILVLNAGSSSLKYQLIEMPSKQVKCVGLVERIGMSDAVFTHEKANQKHSEIGPILDHTAALQKVEAALMNPDYGVLKNVDEIDAIGHRVVHGGSKYTNTVLVTEEVKKNIQELADLAPLHNPAHLIGIEVAEDLFKHSKQAVVFDTAFQQTMPQEAYQYAIPKKYLVEDKIRAYGFHGTSHKYVSEQAIQYLGPAAKNIITIHLGNGCSISAIKDGKCVEHSMGLGPSSGLVMGTRSGDIDLSVVIYLQNKFGKTADEVNHILLKESGLKGLTGHADFRDVADHAAQGDKDCSNALDIVAHRVKKYIGSYAAILNGLDAIVFTAGIGENSSLMRELACKHMDWLGIELDPVKNEIRSKKIREIQKNKAKLKILIIPTNEEIEIAQQTYELLKK